MRIVVVAGVLVVALAACSSGGGGSSEVVSGSFSPYPDATADAKLPGLDTPAPTWYFPAPTAPDPAQVAALEAALGGPVSVAGDAPQSWSFAAGTPTGGGDPRAVAEAIWTAAGLDLGTLDVTVSPDGTTVTATESLGGVASPLPYVVTVDGTGAVVSASGHLATPAPGGDQPRIGTAVAAQQLGSVLAGDDRGEKQPSLRPDPTPAVPPLATEPTTGPPPSTFAPAAVPPVTGVEETYLLTPAADGSAWLLPAYRFVFEGGGGQTVLAVVGTPSVQTTEVQDLVGLPEADAETEAARRGLAYRVAERDGVEQMLTADYSDRRVNVAIADGVVTRASIG